MGFSTVHAFKGLESDVVLLIDLDDLSPPGALAAIYVGASRARALLAVFIDEAQRTAYAELAAKFGISLAGRSTIPYVRE